MHGTVLLPRPPQLQLPRAAHLYIGLPRVAYLPSLPDGDTPIPSRKAPSMKCGRIDRDHRSSDPVPDTGPRPNPALPVVRMLQPICSRVNEWPGAVASVAIQELWPL